MFTVLHTFSLFNVHIHAHNFEYSFLPWLVFNSCFYPTCQLNNYDLVNLQASPCIRFNKEGILLAVSTNDNGVKILGNSDGIRLLRTMENRTFDASRVASAAAVKVKLLSR